MENSKESLLGSEYLHELFQRDPSEMNSVDLAVYQSVLIGTYDREEGYRQDLRGFIPEINDNKVLFYAAGSINGTPVRLYVGPNSETYAINPESAHPYNASMLAYAPSYVDFANKIVHMLVTEGEGLRVVKLTIDEQNYSRIPPKGRKLKWFSESKILRKVERNNISSGYFNIVLEHPEKVGDIFQAVYEYESLQRVSKNSQNKGAIPLATRRNVNRVVKSIDGIPKSIVDREKSLRYLLYGRARTREQELYFDNFAQYIRSLAVFMARNHIPLINDIVSMDSLFEHPDIAAREVLRFRLMMILLGHPIKGDHFGNFGRLRGELEDLENEVAPSQR